MGFGDFIKNIIGKEENSYEKICKERDQSKNNLKETLKKLNFTEIEINQAISVVEDSERKIEKLKSKLPALSRRPEDPTELVNGVYDEIRKETEAMKVNLNNKVQEIIAKKNLKKPSV
jgi:multidrug efflux pump subunit AcrA (membrane-fusion protein)